METKINLVTLYCDKFKCPPEAFEQTVLQRSISPLAWPVARCMLLFRSDVFECDMLLISDMKNATSFSEVSQLIAAYCSSPRRRNLMRWLFKVRVSKRRLKELAREVFTAKSH